MSNDSEFEDSNSVSGGMSAAQKEVVYTKYLPYIDTLTCESEADEILSRIKQQLARSVHLRDVKVSGSHWVGQLTRYIRVYGRKFSKEDHILFVKLLYEIITTPDLEPNLFMKFANILLTLLKKVELLSRDDLVLPWRPLLTVVKEIFFSSPMEQRLKLYPSNIELVVEKVVHSCQVYFAASETSEMLAEFRPLLCPYDTVMIEGVMYLEGFLPVHTAPHEHDISFKLWLPEFLDMWDSLHNSTQMNNTLVNLFSKLAVNNIGYIDWEPYIPKGGGSSTQHHIDQLFVALQSFYHPSNAGKWTGHLAKWLFRLPEAVVNRVHRERHADPTWQTPIPDTHKLTDDDITKFVLSMRSVAFMGIFSKVGSYEASQGVQSLAWLKPDLILPQLLETTYPALETLTEPHRLLSCINTIVGASRPLVTSVDTFPEGRSHVLPLLNLCLPGIDPNDLKKSLVTLQMIGAFVMLVPIADSSHLLHTQTDLTDIERELCSASAQFEDFVLMFMDRIFVLIDNSASYDSNHQDNDPLAKLNPEMILLGHGLVYSFSVVLHQCSPQIYEVVLNRLHRFVQRSVYEVKIGGRFVGDLCRVAARVNPSAALAKFIPYLCTKIQDAINSHENILTEEQLDNELLWHLLILAKVVRCDGGEVVKYKDVLKTTIGSALRLKCRAGYTIASDLLQFTLTAFTTYYNLDYRHAYSDGGVTIRDWGRPGDIDNMKLRWHVPSTEEMATAQELVDTFLTPILAYLQNVPKQDTIDREELEKQLSMLAEILGGIAGAAPSLQGDQVLLRESQVPLTRVTYTCSCDNAEITINGRNVRHVISDILTPLLSHMLEHCEGAIKCFNKVIKVYCTVLFYFGVLKEDFDARWKTYHYVKKQLEDKIIRKRSHTRMCLVTRIQLQHEINNPRTDVHIIYTTSRSQSVGIVHIINMAIYYFYFNLLLSTWFITAHPTVQCTPPTGGELEPQTCLLYKCGGSRLEQPCACDDLCLMYGDCCGDHPILQALNVSEDQQASAQPNTENKPNHLQRESTVQQDTENLVSTDRRIAKQLSAIVPDGGNHTDHRDITLSRVQEHREQVLTVLSTNTETTTTGDRGSIARGEERTALTVPDPRINCMNTQVGGMYLVVDRCPADWHSTGEMNGTDEYVREMCETRYPGALPEYLIPVLESATGLSYRNLFCGVCNGGGVMAMWGYEVHCEESWSQTASRSDSKRFHEVLKKGRCKLRFTEPRRRECSAKYGRHVRCVGEGKRKHARRCPLYVDPIAVKHSIYKNLDCAMCAVERIDRKSCIDLKQLGYGAFRILSLSQLAKFETTHHSSQIQSNQVVIEEEIKCGGGIFYLSQCLGLLCPQGYSMKKGVCVIDQRHYYIVNLNSGSHAAWAWQTQHIYPIIKPYGGRISSTMYVSPVDCYNRYVMCMEAYYQSAQNLSQTTQALLSALYGGYEKFTLKTDLYGKSPLTANCTRIEETKNYEVNKPNISQMLDTIIASYQWPAYINLSVTLGGTSTVAKSNIEVCTLESHPCPLVSVERWFVDKTHAEIRHGFKKFTSNPTRSGKYGLCVNVIREFVKGRRDWRNKGLVVFYENIRRIDDKNDANGGSEVVMVVVCLGVVAVVLTTAK